MHKRRQEWRALLEWFVATNRAILAARDAKGRWFPVGFFGPEGIARIERKLGELVALLARSWWWEIPIGSPEFAEFRETALEVQVRLRYLLGDGYRILKWVEFWERLFFRGLCWSRPLTAIRRSPVGNLL